MPKYKSGYWDGYISLMKDMSTFPTGLLDLVVGKLDEYGVQASLWYKDGRLGDFTTVCENDLSGIILREYQINAANALLGFRRGVAKMATNSGKTEVMAAIIKALHVPKTVVLLHRKE
ncbi:MAG TPA: DEAD/DEAH box helicase family protein, partial [Candidatus Hodarchaeales archaeon]|nr:DEAD/DEAH box helicase family protein [Candidatus Hodarchaeales archaeon]